MTTFIIATLFLVLIAALLLLYFLRINDYRLWYLDLSKLFQKIRKTDRVALYYDQWTKDYLDTYGDVIQGHRSADINHLLDYTMISSGMKPGMKILDAGGGVGGPAIHFASKMDLEIELITNSPVQAGIAVQKIAEHALEHRIRVTTGDFHNLDKFYPRDYFDIAIFLESYGHAVDQAKVLQAASGVLKHNGIIYIKDYFKNYLPDDPLQKKLTRTGISNMNRVYCYNTPDLYHTMYVLRQLCFEIIIIKSPDFDQWDEFRTIMEFQKKHGIDLLEGRQDDMRQHYVLPYELVFRKSRPLH